MSWFIQRDKPKSIKSIKKTAAVPAPARRRALRDMVVFAMFGTMMFCSDILLDGLPNIHLIGVFTMLLTIVYRRYALFPIYIYVILVGLYYGFHLSWLPYLYVWTILWGVTMLLPRKMSNTAAAITYPVVCALHGLAFGTLLSPAMALILNFSFKQMLAWIAAGLLFDLIHAAGNFVAGFLILPLSKRLRKLMRG